MNQSIKPIIRRGRPPLPEGERGKKTTIYLSAENRRWYESLEQPTGIINRALDEYRTKEEGG